MSVRNFGPKEASLVFSVLWWLRDHQPFKLGLWIHRVANHSDSSGRPDSTSRGSPCLYGYAIVLFKFYLILILILPIYLFFIFTFYLLFLNFYLFIYFSVPIVSFFSCLPPFFFSLPFFIFIFSTPLVKVEVCFEGSLRSFDLPIDEDNLIHCCLYFVGMQCKESQVTFLLKVVELLFHGTNFQQPGLNPSN